MVKTQKYTVCSHAKYDLITSCHPADLSQKLWFHNSLRECLMRFKCMLRNALQTPVEVYGPPKPIQTIGSLRSSWHKLATVAWMLKLTLIQNTLETG